MAGAAAATMGSGGLFYTVGLDSRPLKTGVRSAKQVLGQLGLSSTLLTGGAIAGVAGGLALIGAKSVRAAVEFETAMAEVQTIAGRTKAEVAELGDEIERLSTVVPESAVGLARGYYQTLSSGITDTAEALRFLAVASRLAVGSLTTTEVAVDGLTTVMNAYGLSVDQAWHLADVFSKTVDLAKTRLEPLARNIGTVIPIAAEMGVSFEEVSAAIATMTKGGIPLEIALTALRSVLSQILKADDKMIAKAEKLGLAWGREEFEARGLYLTLEDLFEASEKNAQAVSTLLPDVRGMTGALALGRNSVQDYAKDLEAIGTAAGNASKKFGDMMATTENQWKLFTNNVGRKMRGFGDEIADIFKPLLSFLNEQLADTLTERSADLVGSIQTMMGEVADAEDFLSGAIFERGLRGRELLLAYPDLMDNYSAALSRIMDETGKTAEEAEKMIGLEDILGGVPKALDGAKEALNALVERDLMGIDPTDLESWSKFAVAVDAINGLLGEEVVDLERLAIKYGFVASVAAQAVRDLEAAVAAAGDLERPEDGGPPGMTLPPDRRQEVLDQHEDLLDAVRMMEEGASMHRLNVLNMFLEQEGIGRLDSLRHYGIIQESMTADQRRALAARFRDYKADMRKRSKAAVDAAKSEPTTEERILILLDAEVGNVTDATGLAGVALKSLAETLFEGSEAANIFGSTISSIIQSMRTESAGGGGLKDIIMGGLSGGAWGLAAAAIPSILGGIFGGDKGPSEADLSKERIEEMRNRIRATKRFEEAVDTFAESVGKGTGPEGVDLVANTRKAQDLIRQMDNNYAEEMRLKQQRYNLDGSLNAEREAEYQRVKARGERLSAEVHEALADLGLSWGEGVREAVEEMRRRAEEELRTLFEFGEDFGSQLEKLKFGFDLDDVESPLDKLGPLADLIDRFVDADFNPGDYDLSTEAGIDALIERLLAIASADPGAVNINPDQFHDIIRELEALGDEIADGALATEDATDVAFQHVSTITETQANLIATALDVLNVTMRESRDALYDIRDILASGARIAVENLTVDLVFPDLNAVDPDVLTEIVYDRILADLQSAGVL